MRRIVVETKTANKFIEDVEALAAKNNIEIEINMNDLEIYIGFAPLLKAELADIDIPEILPEKAKRRGRPRTKNNVVSIQKFKKTVNSLDKGALAQNITAAMNVTGLSKSFLSRLYYSNEETEKVDDRCYGMLKKLMEPEEELKDPAVEKNMIMIRRVARAKNTDDPYMIANTIMGSAEIQKQTTLKDAGEVIEFIKEHGTC